jgi:3-deoxy-D-manno-octulosonic-acid transferase
MSILLDAGYVLALILASPWILWQAIRKGKYREGWRQKLLGRVPVRATGRKCIWFHAVSVGEVNLLPGLVQEMSARFPDCEIVLSSTTATGYALARERFPGRSVFYFPFDFSWSVREVMKRIRPSVIVLAELELWPNLISQAVALGCRVAVVNARLGDRSFRGYRRTRWFWQGVLQKIDLVAAQNERYARRFAAIGAATDSVSVTGSLKFDNARLNGNDAATKELVELAGIAAGDVVFLAGSTGGPEEEYAIEVYQRLSQAHPELRLILVPRHAERFEDVASLLVKSGLPWRRRSAWEASSPLDRERVLLVDRVGELGKWWTVAQIGFVGGSFNQRGGQNMIEPAASGVATCFGPNTWNFKEVVADLLAADAAVVVGNRDELVSFVRRCLEDWSYREGLGSRARECVLSQQGATARTMDLLSKLVREATETSQRGNLAA